MSEQGKQICLVDMPFGKKPDPKSGVEIQFDQIYERAIEPAIVKAGLSPIRGDREETGGILHTAMFARLLLAEFAIFDMTTGNPNIFYELGVRHTAKPYTTILIFATLGAPPFDVNMVRAIPYVLKKDGTIGKSEAKKLIKEIGKRIERALKGPVAKDSPLFDLFPGFPGIEMSHELTDVFRDRVEYSQGVKDRLAAARVIRPTESAIGAIDAMASEMGDPSRLERGVLIDIYLSYRAIGAYDQMIDLFEQMPAAVKASALARQQLGFALNRRNGPGDRDRAIQVLEELIGEQGDNAETLGILGRIYKDKYSEAKVECDPNSERLLDRAIEAYSRGFEAQPVDFYPGVNAISLLMQKGDDEAQKEIDRLSPLVTSAALRHVGEQSTDYWTMATVLELACTGRDYRLAARCLARALPIADEYWMFETTANNLRLIEKLRQDEEGVEKVGQMAAKLEEAARKMKEAAS